MRWFARCACSHVRILVVDDDPAVSDLLVRALERDGHTLTTASTAARARVELVEKQADVIVLDVGLPDGSGIELCRAIRAQGLDVPILILTARSAVGERIAGLDAGADDFLGKPFALGELRARVRALGRRRSGSAQLRIVRRDVTVDLGSRHALRGDREVALTAREWAILEALAARHGRVVPRAELLAEVWGDATDSADASCEVLVARIRKKLGDGIVRTLRGEGYALGDA